MGLFQTLFSNKSNLNANTNINLSVGDVILLNNFSNAKDLNNMVYPQYLSEKYGIDPITRTRQLIEIELITKADVQTSLNSLTATSLKKICKTYNLPVTGKKEDIIKRLSIIDNISSNIPENLFILSKKGYDTVQQNIDYLKYHKKSFNIDIDDFINYLKKYGTYESAIKNKIMDEAKSYKYSERWGLYRNSLLYLSRICHELNDSCRLLYLLETFYCDLSGLGNSNYRDKLNDLMIAPGLISDIIDCKDTYKPSMIHECIVECNLPKHYFTEASFKAVVEYLLQNENITLKEALSIRRSLKQ